MDCPEHNFMNMSPNDVLEYRLAEMKKSVEKTQYSIPKIQKVAKILRDRKDFTNYYLPKVVSMGPIHHGNSELQEGERYKLIWAEKYIESTKKDPKYLYKEVENHLDQLKDDFADNVLTINTLKSFRSFDEKLAWMLFVDGCSLLYILNTENAFETKETVMKLVRRDVLLLENQLPMPLLYLLCNKNDLFDRIKRFVEYSHSHNLVFLHKWIYDEDLSENQFEYPGCAHVLHYLRTKLLPDSTINKRELHGSNSENTIYLKFERILKHFVSYMNIQDLISNGIRIKSTKRCILTKPSFSHGWLHGELTLPGIILDDIIVTNFLNLIAFETCPDFENDGEVGTYLTFINSLIRQPEDVKDLRSAGILISNYGSDEELVKLFHFMATDIVSNNARVFLDLFEEIHNHMENKWKTNTVRFLKYIRHPWTNFAVHATELALALTFVQTWFTVNPAKSS